MEEKDEPVLGLFLNVCFHMFASYNTFLDDIFSQLCTKGTWDGWGWEAIILTSQVAGFPFGQTIHCYVLVTEHLQNNPWQGKSSSTT
jgi:hypothetical protein